MSDLLQTALKKVEETEVPEVNIAALAYSGGLDSSLCVELLRRKYKAKKIIPIMVDVGQGEEEIKTGLDKAKVLKVEPILINAKDEFTEEWMAKAIMANSDYMGYPVSTSMTRQLIARKVAEKAVELGADALVEGSTGKGNDQYRMHNVFTMFAPGRKIIVPVRDFDLTRSEEEALCRAWGIPVTETIAGGDDKTMWCRSIASGAIDLNMEIPDEVWMWYVPPEKAPDEPRVVELVYEKGIPVAMDGKQMPLKELVPALNEIAGAHGVGKIDIFEEGIMNLKSRELYEAPAATVILKTHRDLEQMCLTKDELLFKKGVEQRWAYMVYHGEWFHPLREALDAFIAKTQEMVRGTVRVKLFKGNVDIIYRDSPTSLFSPEIRSIKAGGFDQRTCADAAKIRGLIFEILAKRRQMIEG
ncbi:TPA: argininosuccinate synthase [Candidatus Poribacteria bacterium]|nr:argininosuccinate synthase [Candidatus Poribacteria bacterium]HEX29230.1 argininosuccinate synthase [Candidatus Poribacteria bacterium]